jgi:hypothetical protein
MRLPLPLLLLLLQDSCADILRLVLHDGCAGLLQHCQRTHCSMRHP